jgi:hypothetical protein
LAEHHGVPVQILGRVGGTKLVINDWIAIDVVDIETSYESTIPALMDDEG